MLSALRDILKPGDSILVKASHGMHFEKVVEFLKAL
jgi:UDP-N-acetylmuramyl pentapeptide synthase